MTASHGPASLSTESGRSATSVPESSGYLLVVDDDPVVLNLLRLCLTRAGFSVCTAAGGRAALTQFENLRDRIDLVLLDVCMPLMDGPETLRELRRIDPRVPCCFMSGYTGVYDAESLQKMGALRLFDKPFNLDDLTESLLHLVGPARLRRTA